MPPRRRPAAFETSRLTILAAGDEAAFLEYAAELLASRDRLAREAAVDALVARPLPAVRPTLIALYHELDADGLKHDQGARMRTGVLRYLRAVGDTRDAAIALRAGDTYEHAFGHDSARLLRAEALKWLAQWSPDLFPYIALEHLSDYPDDELQDTENEPSNTAFQLLANGDDFPLIYQWLRANAGSAHLPRVFELFTGAPTAIVGRFVEHAVGDALAAGDEPMCTLLAESIVGREIEAAYGALASMLAAKKISLELHAYLAMLLAGTNRPPLLAILEHELFHGRRRDTIIEALHIRTTPEQAAILKRWDERE